MATPTPSPAPVANPLDFQPFITSRKTFDTEVHAWYDLPGPFAGELFSVGPYAAWGASTIPDKNELEGEAINVPTGDAGEGQSTQVDGNQVLTGNDVKQYKELGIHFNTLLFSRKVFIETIVAEGWYEAMQGLYEGKDTRSASSANCASSPAA